MGKWFCAIFVNRLPHLAGVCDVWGGHHHLTFDGKTYNFTKNCTYYLVKEIITKYNLTITVNRVCDSSDSIRCSQIFTVIYGSTTVVFKEISPTPEYAVRNYSNFSNNIIQTLWLHLSNFLKFLRHTDMGSHNAVLSSQSSLICFLTLPYRFLWMENVSTLPTPTLSCASQAQTWRSC